MTANHNWKLALAPAFSCLFAALVATAIESVRMRAEPPVDKQCSGGRETPACPVQSPASLTTPVRSAKPGVNLACSVVNYKAKQQKPVLTLLCPGNETAAPVRVYLKLSWMGEGDRPSYYRDIVARPKTSVVMHSDESGALVWLRTRSADSDKQREGWVRFSELVALEVLSPN